MINEFMKNQMEASAKEEALQTEELNKCRAKWTPIIAEIEVLYQQMLDMAETEDYDFTEEAIEDMTNALEGL